MSMRQQSPPDWPTALRRYLGASAAAHLGWEVLQLPLYTLWTTGTPQQKMFAVLHCTIGDVMIAGLSLLLALALVGRPTWPKASGAAVYLTCLALGIGYTIFSEWLNVSVRGSWAYSSWMPTLPLVGTGVSPLLQWVVVPTLALSIAARRPPWEAASGTRRPSP